MDPGRGGFPGEKDGLSEGSGGDPGLEGAGAAALQEVVRHLDQADGVVHAADPDGVRAKPLCPAGLVREGAQPDDDGPLETVGLVQHPEDVGRVPFPEPMSKITISGRDRWQIAFTSSLGSTVSAAKPRAANSSR